jgi:hypothetical protein
VVERQLRPPQCAIAVSYAFSGSHKVRFLESASNLATQCFRNAKQDEQKTPVRRVLISR